MHALVTGGAGLIGSHLVDLLIARGYDVTILDNLDAQTHPMGVPAWIPAKARFIQGDVRSVDDLRKAMDGVDVIFHQAAFGGFTPDYSVYMDANATGTARIFETIANYNLPIKKVVAASSQAIYGEGTYHSEKYGVLHMQPRPISQLENARWELEDPDGMPMKPVRIKEDVGFDGKTAYAISKFAEERLTLSLGQMIGVPTVALRYSVTYGPRQSIYNPYTGVVSIFSTRILNNLAPVVYEDGQQTRDFTFVEDIASANLFCMENDACNFQPFNAGGGESITVERLIRNLISLYGKQDVMQPEMRSDFRPGDARHMVPDPTKLMSLGWKPQVTLEEGLHRYVEWIKTQGDVKEYFTDAQERLRKMKVVRSSQ